MQCRRYQRSSKSEEWAYSKGFFSAIDYVIRDELTDDQREKLSICNQGILYTVEDQIFLRYIDNRYWDGLDKEEIVEVIGSCIENYRFLLNSDLEPQKIRHHFIRALMDVISTGSGTYFLKWDAWHNQFWLDRHVESILWGQLLSWFFKRIRLWSAFTTSTQRTFWNINKQYPNLSQIQIFKDVYTEKSSDPFQVTCSLWDQLVISYSYPIFLKEKMGKWNSKEFQVDFLLRHRWCLERLSRCKHAFINKYKEKLCTDLSNYLGKDPDCTHIFLNLPPRTTAKTPSFSDVPSEIKQTILNCFSPQELSLFMEIDASGNKWDFEGQMEDRYRLMYPSFAAQKEINESITKIIQEYKPLLNPETAEVVREIIFDEIENIAFVSWTTHLWNLEMEKNLKRASEKPADKEIIEAVDFLISQLPKDYVDHLSIQIENKEFSLRDQLLARWRKGIFASNTKKFGQYLSRLFLYTSNSPSNWKNPPSRIDLQAFLGEIDMFFLYPQQGQKIKKLFSRLDTGRVMGGDRAEERIYMSFRPPDEDRFLFFRSTFARLMTLTACTWIIIILFIIRNNH